jgi:hypothetical protein
VWATAKLSAFIAVVGVAGWLFFQDQIQSKLCSTLQSKCNRFLDGSGIETTIGNAQFFDQQGMLLSNLQVQAPNVSLTAYETFLAMSSNTTDLVTGNCDVDGIEMRLVEFEIVRSTNESFDMTALVKLFEAINNATKETRKRLIPIAIIDSRIHVVDRATGFEKTISDINLKLIPIEHDGRVVLQVHASAATTEVQHVDLRGYVDPKTGQWSSNLTLDGANVSSDVFAVLPRDIQQQLSSIKSVSSRVDGSVHAKGNWKTNELSWFEGQGIISQLNLEHHRLPAAIRNGFAKFQFTPRETTVQEITGLLGSSPFTAHYEQTDLLNPTAWRLNGKLDKFHFDGSEKTLNAMPAAAKRLATDFQTRGNFDCQFDVRYDGKRIKKSADIQISDLEFNFNKFPYPVSDCFGQARWIDDQITYELYKRSRDQELSAKGFVNNPGPNATWKCILKTERGQLRFDDTLQTAIDANPPLAKTIRAFNAHGWVAGSGTLEKFVAGGEVRKTFDIDLIDLTMQHERFPYFINSVQGKIRSVDRSFRFDQITGSNGIGKILCNGTWNPRDGLNARYICNNIQLDERLRKALRPELKEVWDGFRPRGTATMTTVDMTLPVGADDCNLIVKATLNGESEGVRKSNLSIYPTWFPYELNDLAGTLIVGDGKVQLRDFRGRHGQNTVVTCNGDGAYSPDGWEVRLSNLLTQSLRADAPLMRALPDSLAQPIQYMKFDGLLNVYGTMTLAGQYRKPQPLLANRIRRQPMNRPAESFVQQASFTRQAPTVQPLARGSSTPDVSMGWELRFDMNQAEMFLGIPVKNVFGSFNLFGQYDGENVECRGSVKLDSLTIYDTQLTNVRGPVWFDNVQALAGGMINQLSTGQSPSPSVKGEMFGGVVNLDAAISSDQEGRFVIQTTLADGNLKQLAQEYAPGLEDVQGRTFAALTMQGDARGTHTCRGSGQIHLRDAKIYEFRPVMRLLKILQVKRVDDVAFDSGDIFFAVNGEDVDINRMEFNGDAISLIGNGRLNMDQDLDLNFYSVMGRNRINIPLISELYRRSSQKFMWINIGGTCGNPQITHEIMPELNDSIRQLFQQSEAQ